ncbi:hypothetical protein, partial [Raoultella sp. C349492]|uniref:hypothetical protein n=1 Tax=Raoultella sp. C349492 TaxID=2970253 RepID=UPI0035C6A4B5
INNPQLMAPINCLMRAGLTVVDFHDLRRPVIEVERPLKSWEHDAVEITENKDGVKNTVKMTIFRGAHIIWREMTSHK